MIPLPILGLLMSVRHRPSRIILKEGADLFIPLFIESRLQWVTQHCYFNPFKMYFIIYILPYYDLFVFYTFFMSPNSISE